MKRVLEPTRSSRAETSSEEPIGLPPSPVVPSRIDGTLDDASIGFFTLDANGVILASNRTAVRYLHSSHQQIQGEPLWKFLVEDAKGILSQALSQCRESGRRTFLDVLLAPGQESSMRVVLVIDLSLPLPRQAAGVQYRVTMVDISGLQFVQLQNQGTDSQYRLLFESNPHPMWVYDIESLRFLAVNDAALARYGYAREELLRMTILDIHPAESHEQIRQATRIGPPSNRFAGVWRQRKKNGSMIDVEVYTHDIIYEGHRARLVDAKDVTDRMRAERSLRDTMRRLRAYVERSRDLALVVDETGVIQAISEPGAELLAERHGELIGQNCLMFVPPEEVQVLKKMYMRLLMDPFQVQSALMRIRRRNGVSTWIELEGSGLTAENTIVGFVINFKPMEVYSHGALH